MRVELSPKETEFELGFGLISLERNSSLDPAKWCLSQCLIYIPNYNLYTYHKLFMNIILDKVHEPWPFHFTAQKNRKSVKIFAQRKPNFRLALGFYQSKENLPQKPANHVDQNPV